MPGERLGRTYSAATWGEVNTEMRIMVLPFAWEKVDARFGGLGTVSVAAVVFGISADGTANVQGCGAMNQAVAVDTGFASSIITGLSEATHFVNVMANTFGSGGTLTLYGSSAQRATFFCTVGA